jgi:hypothetical protein
MEQRYNEMNIRNCWNQTKPQVNSDLGDGRCLAAYALGKWTLTPEFYSLSKRLKNILGDCICLYNPLPKESEGYLHQTLLQFVRFYYKDYPKDSLEKAMQEVANILQKYRNKYRIRYRGLVWTPTGIALSGYSESEDEIMRFRMEIEETLKEKDLPCEIPYKNDILHATLFRWIREPNENQLERLNIEVKKEEKTFFGEINIEKWIIGEASWRMQENERKDIYFTD